MSNIAIMGGTFSPPHVGHVLMAQYVLLTQQIDQVFVVPVFKHPLEWKKPAASFDHRVNMCLAAFDHTKNVAISLAEKEAVEAGGGGYTLEMARLLTSKYPNESFHLVLGTDCLRDFPTWDNTAGLLDLVKILPIGRPGYEVEWEGRKIPTVLPEVSSTKIRQGLAANSNIDHLVPKSVLRYIRENNLYLP